MFKVCLCVCPSQSDFSIDDVVCWIGEHRRNKLIIGNRGWGIRICTQF